MAWARVGVPMPERGDRAGRERSGPVSGRIGADILTQAINDPMPFTPVQPVQLGLDDSFQFRCHKGIACFNKCCENIDIMLAPYDLLRLKQRFGLTSRAFLDEYTRDFQMDAQGMPGLKLKTREGSTACTLLTPEGCSVYADRPSACRYYALGLLALRKADSPQQEDSYFVVKEEHCLGHFEPKVRSVRDYRGEQGIDEYDEMNREWREIVLKKRSGGTAVGKPSARSLELFFLASYDLEGFREFVASPAFQDLFVLEPELNQSLMQDDVALLRFAFRFLKQVLFGESTIAVDKAAVTRRMERFRQRSERLQREAEKQRVVEQDQHYQSLGD